VSYRERATAVPGAVLWRSVAGADPGPTLILPDGCLDLLWDGRRLFIAGPDTIAHRYQAAQPGDRCWALRFGGGLGPALLGLPADSLTDRLVDLDDLWPAAAVRRLTEQVADDPAAALSQWLLGQVQRSPADPLGARVVAMAGAGASVATMADRTGLSVRQLHRRCLPLFGYGPRHLGRVLRLQRALARGRAGQPLAEVAAGTGYFDQAHLSREVRALAGTTPTELLAPARRA
jgi:AraC-like DNA-binding protein